MCGKKIVVDKQAIAFWLNNKYKQGKYLKNLLHIEVENIEKGVFRRSVSVWAFYNCEGGEIRSLLTVHFTVNCVVNSSVLYSVL